MSRIIFVAIAAVLVVAAATVGRFVMMDDGGASTSAPGGVQIGGPFTLTDHTGKTVTDEDFRGDYMLVYFGYTYCPDVCPTSLGIIGRALDQLAPEELAKIQPIFISVDPDRDTPDVLADYVPSFHPKMIGLTGTGEQIKSVSKAYKAYYAKVNADDPENYLMDHSSFTYLIGPDGQYVTHFNHGTAPEKMAARLSDIL